MDLNNQEVRKTKVLKDIQPDEKLAEEIQSNLDKQLKEKQLEESEELKTILHGVTGKVRKDCFKVSNRSMTDVAYQLLSKKKNSVARNKKYHPCK